MPRVVAYEDAKANKFRRKGIAYRTPFFESSVETPDLPVAQLSEGDAGRVINPHFHLNDQWQVIVDGGGAFGRHEVAPYAVHFTRAFTPYGPTVANSKTGISSLTLFARFEVGAQYLPESLEKLKQVPDRRPWQITRQVTFPFQEGIVISPGTVLLQEVPDVKDDQGLAAYSLTMAPNTTTAAPDPSCGDGQYLIVVKGGLWHENKMHKALTLVFTKSTEDAFNLHAGEESLAAIIVNYPQRTKDLTTEKIALSTINGFKKWQCELCAFAYDEALGLPDDGIPAGTRWKDVPDSWSCPDCSASKSNFAMVKV
jgi:rubredoxin